MPNEIITIRKPKHKMKHKALLLSFLIFLFLVVVTLYYAFGDDSNSVSDSDSAQNSKDNNEKSRSKITGFITKETPSENKLKINSDLSIPNLEINTESSTIEIKTGRSNSIITLGTQKFDLSNLGGSDIVLFDFSGKISFSPDGLLDLEGRTSKALINEIPTTPETSSSLKVKVDENFLYKTIKISDISLRSISYQTYGKIIINEMAELELKNDFLDIINYKGDLEIKSDSLILEGEADRIKITGNLNIEIS